MEASTAKRRKLSHSSGGLALSTGVTSTSAASAFVEATQDLLHDVQLDYAKVFDGVDQTLRQFKDTIEGLDTHEPALVGSVLPNHTYPQLILARLAMSRPLLKRRRRSPSRIPAGRPKTPNTSCHSRNPQTSILLAPTSYAPWSSPSQTWQQT
jgi:hypothetical protein